MTAPTADILAPAVTGDVMSFGPNDPPITVEQMIARDKLITLDQGREVLAQTEPLAFVPFETGENVRFRFEDGWNENIATTHGTEALDVYMSIGPTGASHEYQLSLDAVHQAASVPSIGKGYIDRCPAELAEDQLNYWFRAGLDKSLQLMVVGERQKAAGITRESVEPFSNLAVLDRVLAVIERLHPGSSVYVDRNKLTHSLRLTHLQLVLPEVSRIITDTGEVDDSWWGGIQWTNSMTAEKQSAFDAFMFRQRCTNGMIDVRRDSGVWSRKSSGQDMESVLAWAETAVEEALGSFDGIFERVQGLVGLRLDPNTVSATAEDLFEQFRIPTGARRRIITNLVESDQLTMYALTNAVTAAANGLDVGSAEQQVLMRTGGDVIRHAERCDGCHRMLPDGVDGHHH
jgi:hypothetical protein